MPWKYAVSMAHYQGMSSLLEKQHSILPPFPTSKSSYLYTHTEERPRETERGREKDAQRERETHKSHMFLEY